MRALVFVLLVYLTACAPAASSPSASPTNVTAVTPATPTATAVRTTAAPTASATPIALPTTAFVAAASGGVLWMYLNGDHLFQTLNRGDTWTERSMPPTTPPSGYPASS